MTEQAWRPIARVRAHEQVIDRIEEQILAGTLEVGDLLPGERELAARLGVSRPAVREAIRVLEAQGVVRAGAGSGAEAGTRVSALPADGLTRLLRLHVALANIPVDDVVDARIMLERSSARLAAEHASQEQLSAIRAPLEAMDRVDDRNDFNELDTGFHIAIAEASRNRLVAAMTTAIRESTKRPILQGIEAMGGRWPSLRKRLRAEHHAIYDALAAGDGDAAADLVEAHIRSAHETLRKASGG